MATLEKIRSKSVFLIVIIGLALLAFIVGDALTNSRNLFGDHTTVAKVGDAKIDIHEYQAKREELNRRLEDARRQNPQQFANFDTQVLAQMAVEELLTNKLLDNGADRLGLHTSGDQLRYYVLENPVNTEDLQNIMRQLQSAGINVGTPAQAYEVIFKPTANGLTEAQAEPFKRAWLAMEQKTAQMVKRNTYAGLVAGTVQANDLDRKALYNDFVQTRNVSLAYRPYGQLDEKKYPVSDSEVLEAYNKEKNRFRVTEPTKEASVIAVSIRPSDADRAAAANLAKKTVAALRDSAASLPADVRKEGVVLTRHQLRAADLPAGAVKNYVLNAPKDSVSIVSESLAGFTVVKMGKRRAEVDSIQINIVNVAGTALPSKVLARLNAGLDADSIASVFPADSVMAQTNMWIPLFTADGATNAIEPAMMDSLDNAAGRYTILTTTPQGAMIGKVVKKNAPVEVYEYEEAAYALNPSTATVAEARNKLEKYLAENNTPEKFIANAQKEGYVIIPTAITPSVPAIPSYQGYWPESRKVARWVVVDAKAGDVSGIFENKDAAAPVLYAAAVSAAYDDFVPVSNKEVKEMLTQQVRREKAGKALVAEYKKNAKSVADVAKNMGVEPQNYEAFRFGRNGIIMPGEAMGRINGTPADKKLYVISDDGGVYGYVVTGAQTQDFPYNAQSYDRQYQQMVKTDFPAMLRGAKSVKNNTYKFEGGE